MQQRRIRNKRKENKNNIKLRSLTKRYFQLFFALQTCTTLEWLSILQFLLFFFSVFAKQLSNSIWLKLFFFSFAIDMRKHKLIELNILSMYQKRAGKCKYWTLFYLKEKKKLNRSKVKRAKKRHLSKLPAKATFKINEPISHVGLLACLNLLLIIFFSFFFLCVFFCLLHVLLTKLKIELQLWRYNNSKNNGRVQVSRTTAEHTRCDHLVKV